MVTLPPRPSAPDKMNRLLGVLELALPSVARLPKAPKLGTVLTNELADSCPLSVFLCISKVEDGVGNVLKLTSGRDVKTGGISGSCSLPDIQATKHRLETHDDCCVNHLSTYKETYGFSISE